MPTHSVERPGYAESALCLAKTLREAMLDANLPKLPEQAAVLRFVQQLCASAFFQPATMICATMYLERLDLGKLLAPLPPPQSHSQARAQASVRGGISGARASQPRGAGEETLVNWQLLLLALLTLSAKQWDSDVSLSTTDLCLPGTLASSGWEGCTAATVVKAERTLLSALDYCTMVQQMDFARFYLTKVRGTISPTPSSTPSPVLKQEATPRPFDTPHLPASLLPTPTPTAAKA